MTAPPTVGALLKAKVVTSAQVSSLVEAVLEGRLVEDAVLTKAYILNLAAAVRENRFATAILRDKTTTQSIRRNAVRTAILLARAQQAGPPEGHASALASNVSPEFGTAPSTTLIEQDRSLISGTAASFGPPGADAQNGPVVVGQAPSLPANSIIATVRQRWARARPFAAVSDRTLEHKLRSAPLQPRVRDLVRCELALRARALRKR